MTRLDQRLLRLRQFQARAVAAAEARDVQPGISSPSRSELSPTQTMATSASFTTARPRPARRRPAESTRAGSSRPCPAAGTRRARGSGARPPAAPSPARPADRRRGLRGRHLRARPAAEVELPSSRNMRPCRCGSSGPCARSAGTRRVAGRRQRPRPADRVLLAADGGHDVGRLHLHVEVRARLASRAASARPAGRGCRSTRRARRVPSRRAAPGTVDGTSAGVAPV